MHTLDFDHRKRCPPTPDIVESKKTPDPWMVSGVVCGVLRGGGEAGQQAKRHSAVFFHTAPQHPFERRHHHSNRLHFLHQLKAPTQSTITIVDVRRPSSKMGVSWGHMGIPVPKVMTTGEVDVVVGYPPPFFRSIKQATRVRNRMHKCNL